MKQEAKKIEGINISKLATTNGKVSEDAIKNQLRDYTPNFDNEITFGVEIEFLGPQTFDYPEIVNDYIDGLIHGSTSTRIYTHWGKDADAGYRKMFAAKLAQMTGMNIVSAAYSNHSYDAETWMLKGDCSVKTRARGKVGYLELVSPILKGQEGLKALRKIYKAMKEAGCSVNASCGSHIHLGIRSFFNNTRVGINSWDRQTEDHRNLAIKRVFDVYAEYEVQLDTLVNKKRRANRGRYCRSTRRMANFVDPRAIQVETMRDDMTTCGRYHKLNLSVAKSRGTIENRQFQGTLNFNDMYRWIWLNQKMIHRALMGGILVRNRAMKDEGGNGRTFAHLLGYLRADRNKYGRDVKTTKIVDMLRKKNAKVVKNAGRKITDRVSSICAYAD